MDAIGGDGGGEELIHICEKTGHDAAAAPVLFFKTGKSYPPEIAIRCLNGFQSALLFSRRRLYSQDQLTVLPHAAAKYGQCMGQKLLAGFLLEGQNGCLDFFISLKTGIGMGNGCICHGKYLSFLLMHMCLWNDSGSPRS